MTKERYPVEYTTKIVCSNYTALISITAKDEKTIDKVMKRLREGKLI